MIARFLLLQVITPHDHQDQAIENMAELEQLVHTYGGEVVEKSSQHRVHPHPGTFVGGGKVEWLKQTVKDKEIDVVVLNAIAKSSQLFCLEKALWEVNTQIKVWDKVDLILHIFDQHATTTEAKLQIELARIQHAGPRIYGLGGTVLSRQGGGIGTRGLGETNIQIERQQMKKRIQFLKKQIDKRAAMQSGRIKRRQNKGVYTAALVGYTSAGKTTLFNALTNKQKKTHGGLFTTLDSVVGKIKFAKTPPVLVSDTIGFIEDLPPNLVSAFRSTLQESLQARLLLQVIDASDPDKNDKIQVVNEILEDMGITDKPIFILNKTDLLSDKEIKQLKLDFADQPHFLVSALTGEGIPQLKKFLQTKQLNTQNKFEQSDISEQNYT